MNIPQTSASERIEHARKVLREHGHADAEPGDPGSIAQLTLALRSLIEPPAVGNESVAKQIAADHFAGYAPANLPTDLTWEHLAQSFGQVSVAAFAAGVQSAHESWEPADVPSQEFMLRHLGIEHSPSFREGYIYIEPQHIEKEVI